MGVACKPLPGGGLGGGRLQILLDDEARLSRIDHGHRPPVALTRFLEFTGNLQPGALRQNHDRCTIRRGPFPEVELGGCPNYCPHFIDR